MKTVIAVLGACALVVALWVVPRREPMVAAVTYFYPVTFSDTDMKFSGAVGSPKDECKPNRKVTLLVRQNGDLRVLGLVYTEDNGAFSIDTNGPGPGPQYRGRVTERQVGDITCRGDELIFDN
jgi:hypothetical protein